MNILPQYLTLYLTLASNSQQPLSYPPEFQVPGLQVTLKNERNQERERGDFERNTTYLRRDLWSPVLKWWRRLQVKAWALCLCRAEES